MNYNIKYPATMARQSFSKYQVNVRESDEYKPVGEATVAIKKSGPDAETIEVLKTDGSGQTITIELEAPPRELSEVPQELRPYAEYTVEVTKDGYEPTVMEGSQVLADTKSIQEVRLEEVAELERHKRYMNYTRGGYRNNRAAINVVPIAPHTLYGEYPPKIPEEEVKKLPFAKEGLIVLPEVVVPEYIVVHDGTPDDTTAPNYFVQYKDYITNVCSSEIYATWPVECIVANILAINSFVLNRVYTEWYRGKGYDFTITSSTAYDQKFTYGRNYYENIQRLVDEIFANYITRPGIKQPLFSQYCDGVKVQCEDRGWMTQWGSKAKAEDGASAIAILKSFYGEDIYIETAELVSGVPASWPGANLALGTSGNNVRVIQEQLNAISNNYPAIPKVKVDGSFGEGTEEAVKVFQSVFGLPPTGIVDYPTWYKISDIFVAVTRIAELN